jgi:tight adherence protein B
MTLALAATVAVGLAIFFAASAVLSPAGGGHAVTAARLAGIGDAEMAFAPSAGAGTGGRLRPSRLDRQLIRAPLGSALRRDLLRSGLAWQVRDYVGVMLVLAMIGAGIGWVVASTLGAAAGVFVGAAIPTLVVKRIAAKRAARLNSQIVDLIDLLSSSLRAGFSFMQSIDLAVREQPDPIAAELRHVMRETSLGVSTDDALQRMADRTDDEDLALVVTAVLIQRRVGGNLAEVLGGIVGMIRDRVRIRGEIHTLTAQARMSAWIIGALPIVLAIVMTLMQHDYMAALFNELAGRLVLAGAVVLEIVGMMIIRRIASIDY